MKKYLVIAIFALAAFGFVGCSEDADTKADLKWDNQSGAQVDDIQWLHNSSVNQTWSGQFGDNAQTGYKGISELAGSGECQSGGSTAEIVLDTGAGTGYSDISANSATITENASATLVIQSAKKK